MMGEEPVADGTTLPKLRALTDPEIKRLDQLKRKLSSRNGVRHIAESLWLGESHSAATLLSSVAGPDAWWRERVLAAWLLPRLTLDDVQRAGALRALSTAAGNRAVLSPLWGCAGCVMGPLGLITIPSAFVLSMVLDNRLHRVRAAAAEALGEMGDSRATGPLAKAIRAYGGAKATSGSQVAEKAAADALPRVLRDLKPSDYGVVERGTIADLCWVLAHAREPLALAILEALEKVGDGSALRAVEHLARTSRFPALRAEANRILPTLQERFRKATEAQSLLRAAEPGGAEDVLLRPATETGPAEPERLLRSVSESEAGEESV
jgi:HEAT repeat protein